MADSTGGPWAELRRELRSSTPQTKRALIGATTTVSVVVIVAIVDAVTGSPGQEPFRLVGIVVTAIALQLRVVAGVIWEVGSAAATRGRPTGGSVPVHRAMQQVPAINAVSAVLFAVAAGLFIPSVLRSWFFLAFGLGVFALAVWTAREVIQGTRVLYARAAEGARAADQALAEATAARLTALQAQMNPHFLFNALNTVASLVRTDPARAEVSVERLASVLRRTLDRSEQRMCTIGDEIDYLRAFLALEEERFGDALHVEWNVQPAALERRVPVMALQPLVENALEHGIGNRVAGGTIRISAGVDASTSGLHLAVIDDGPGFAPGAMDHTGLSNLRRRLATIYGGEAVLSIESGDGGTTVALQLPSEARGH